jgi:hypothetical protein
LRFNLQDIEHHVALGLAEGLILVDELDHETDGFLSVHLQFQNPDGGNNAETIRQ